ncbi:MAG TPA: hypothetical protein VHS74_05620 [Solirubrobacterales bacterium]|jgi:hypothetical protein|nr:hypothetical protein [Solirubrobacterales bacterium]
MRTIFGTTIAGQDFNSTGVKILIVLGILLAAWAIWELWQVTRKKCPDCAKGCDKSANVCPNCGYRFAPSPGAAK